VRALSASATTTGSSLTTASRTLSLNHSTSTRLAFLLDSLVPMMLGIDYNGTGTAAAGADDGTAS